MAGLTYLDFDLQIEPRARGYRAQVINSPVGQATVSFELPFDAKDLEIFLLRVGGRTRGTTRRVQSSDMELVKDFGARLFGAVFKDTVRDCLRRSIDIAAHQRSRLRLRLRLNDVPELANLPWEYLFSPTDSFLALSV